MNVTGGTTDVTTYHVIRTSADGKVKTGATIADIDLQYVRTRDNPSAKVDAIELGAINGAHEDNKAKEVDATGADGLYRIDWPDAAFVAGVPQVILTPKLADCFVEHMAVDIDSPVNATMWNDVALGTTNPLPNAAADAAGGLPISDAGGLDLDTKLANTNEVTAVRMATLTDWINGGRLDLLLDAIPTTAMRGTDNAALAAVCTAARLGALTDWIDGGRLDLLLDAIPTTAMRGTDGVSLVIPDAAGTAAALHAITNALAPLGTAMRGTDGVSLVIPDAAGTAAALHAVTDALIGALGGGDATLAQQVIIVAAVAAVQAVVDVLVPGAAVNMAMKTTNLTMRDG